MAELDCGRIDADVDLTGLKRDNTGGSFGHNTEGQVLGGLDAAVVVLKCMHGDVVAVRPGIEDVRAAADGVAVGFVRFHGSLVQDAERRIRNIIKDIADLVFQNDLNRVVVDLVDSGDHSDLVVGSAGVDGTLKGEQNIVSGQLVAVVELDALADVELPGGVGGLLVAFSNLTLKALAVGGELDQRIMDALLNKQVHRCVGLLNVEVRDILGQGDRDGFLVAGGGFSCSSLGRTIAGLRGSCGFTGIRGLARAAGEARTEDCKACNHCKNALECASLHFTSPFYFF